ncbi:dTDP-4-dehydrorhamnose 3,5-epimerase [Pandoraea nosoerga]|uniref:dTDP-4-dehydrorhamnose 3,5-epimerase n=1 Tax=Pandoraea nosoerga TaxID=2508296 RepID=A0A5E4WBI7_9BURK|nr:MULTISPECIES: dTDP-4-dehydrorhamnose 3,5-epimerase [Pandoraea]MBN4665878.1 dTDP-4-dehydrorhamnose 3,5-epimerase [Pandoraea nosoerga]MBN4676052.1 dTDP-4-dehydrorhamnose 3,5-epimerase [Pandoraea nosoerga]MBN4681923.1 dTDP-4-dehydrorhamnose 3,5-epimerase [Pandoraea nosoerga]MBN4745079.1 dTDP-4-dehydrorhamnose 3,5-epimerase [Pandoraea nosoerga]VVE21024.1 dTDP-4-dehydrorhamnose 3,5-epimerase [Pandoraea nosoerga]
MQLIATAIADVKVVEPKVFGDSRGYFFESFNQRQFDDALGKRLTFVQDNQSRSARGVLRGLHYQVKQPQGKLVRVLQGEIYDVAVDIRQGSPTFGKWVAEVLSAQNKKQLWIPAGFAHGFVVTSETAEVLYKTTDYWAPQYERCIRWDDPTLAIPWPLDGITPIVSDKDKVGMLFADYRHED